MSFFLNLLPLLLGIPHISSAFPANLHYTLPRSIHPRQDPVASCGGTQGLSCATGCCSEFSICGQASSYCGRMIRRVSNQILTYTLIGTTPLHCGWGCQKSFGRCDPNPQPVSVVKCGAQPDGTNLSCESGYCCSQYG